MRFHSQAPDLHNCNTKKQEKKLQPKRTHLLCNTQKPTNSNNNNWELGSSSKSNYFQKYLLLLTQYNNHNYKNTHKFWLILDSFLLTIFAHSLTRSKLSLSLSLSLSIIPAQFCFLLNKPMFNSNRHLRKACCVGLDGMGFTQRDSEKSLKLSVGTWGTRRARRLSETGEQTRVGRFLERGTYPSGYQSGYISNNPPVLSIFK
jgi:hypothetical protein